MNKLYLAQCIYNEPDPTECVGDIKVFLTAQERDDFIKEKKKEESEYEYWTDHDIDIPATSLGSLPALTGPGYTPNAGLPPLFNSDSSADGARQMIIKITVPADFEKRLDNQWVVEREIHADRWSWEWADEYKS